MIKAAYISHSDCLKHDMGSFHPECPDRVAVVADRLLAKGLLDCMDLFEAPEVTAEQAMRAHEPRVWHQLLDAEPGDGYVMIDPDTLIGPRTVPAVLRAAGAAVLATDLVAAQGYRRAFCNVRPPGHHAERGRAMGFCFLNNVAIGIMQALDVHGLERVALVDFDVHHGNGSEQILADDPRVLMVSTYQTELYPYSGAVALGDNIHSVGLPAYSDGRAMRTAFESQLLPELEAFEPQMIFVSAGFDAHRDDELAMLGWVDADYAWATRRIVEIADRFSEGRIVSTLEGGYALPALARSAELHVRALLELD